jgi:rod shape-determining protein MreC
LKKPVLNITLGIKTEYINFIESVQNFVQKHIDQEKNIQKLQNEVAKLKKAAILSSAFASRLRSVLQDKSPVYNPELNITRAVSYVDLANYNRVWLDFKILNKNKIYGLVYQGYSAGIVTEKNNRALGLLQGDEKCIFSVYIGKTKVPGVIFGDKDDMIVRYIPGWMKIKKDDEVYTSGLDNIFFEGIKVGKVTEIIKEESYTSAIVKPYAKVEVPGYFHIITKQ